MARAAFLSARNDVLINLAIIAMGVLTLWTASGWPDLVLGTIIVILNLRAAKEVWEVAEEERLAAKALAGEDID
jgi:Co/Zn/Cd efflux system component